MNNAEPVEAVQAVQQMPPGNAIQGESSESRRSHGGKRPGAGRKVNLAKRLLKGFTRDTIALAVEDLDVKTVIIGLLKSKSDRTRLETLAFLRDTLHGRPGQSVSVSGGLIHAHTDWRPLAQTPKWNCSIQSPRSSQRPRMPPRMARIIK
jgi:hypothetical protein